MADTATQSCEQVDKVTLKVMVDKERIKVLYAEAGNDFVDALFSFLTLPLGTIARLVGEDSNIEAVRFGSISSLYPKCKDMLLRPRSSMETNCQKIKLNIYNTPLEYYLCGRRVCWCVGIFCQQKCLCGNFMNAYVCPSALISVDNGFVKETATFIIYDDLSVMPNDLVKSLCFLQMNGINDIVNIERKTIFINKKEVVDILKLSLLSKTPLTDFILKKKQILPNPTFQSEIRNNGKSFPSEEGKQMLIKLLVRKSTKTTLFVIAEEDFADFLFSFLTFPMGGVLEMLEGLSSLSSIDILYKSMTELSPERYLRSQELKDELCKPQIHPSFEVRNQILPIKTTVLINKSREEILEFVDPRSSFSGAFARMPLTIMVTDDLVVTPMSSFDCVSYLERMKVPLNDVEDIVINIGVKEGLSILKASLTSTSAFTNGLKQHLDMYNLKKPKKENEA